MYFFSVFKRQDFLDGCLRSGVTRLTSRAVHLKEGAAEVGVQLGAVLWLRLVHLM
jgi:hypothetical protein